MFILRCCESSGEMLYSCIILELGGNLEVENLVVEKPIDDNDLDGIH